MSYKGIFKPSRPEKYIGDHKNIIYRSLWERKFMVYCDSNENIIKWSSEEIWIPYVSPIDNRVHKYFPDFIIKVKEKTGQLKTYVIEVKPKKQTTPPQKKTRTTKSYLYECKTYAVNQAKWKAAEEFCLDRRWQFRILTEDNLGI